jgi:hypothetical protein
MLQDKAAFLGLTNTFTALQTFSSGLAGTTAALSGALSAASSTLSGALSARPLPSRELSPRPPPRSPAP